MVSAEPTGSSCAMRSITPVTVPIRPPRTTPKALFQVFLVSIFILFSHIRGRLLLVIHRRLCARMPSSPFAESIPTLPMVACPSPTQAL